MSDVFVQAFLPLEGDMSALVVGEAERPEAGKRSVVYVAVGASQYRRDASRILTGDRDGQPYLGIVIKRGKFITYHPTVNKWRCDNWPVSTIDPSRVEVAMDMLEGNCLRVHVLPQVEVPTRI
jgi:hypothetical protein